jgi:hypothetical protein
MFDYVIGDDEILTVVRNSVHRFDIGYDVGAGDRRKISMHSRQFGRVGSNQRRKPLPLPGRRAGRSLRRPQCRGRSGNFRANCSRKGKIPGRRSNRRIVGVASATFARVKKFMITQFRAGTWPGKAVKPVLST